MTRDGDSFATPADLGSALDAVDYIAEEALATTLFLALRMGRPLLIEGEPGVGKTEAAKALAAVTGRSLVRLQCYEGLDAAQALYEWNYPRQLLAIRQAEGRPIDIYSDEFLIERALLATLRNAADTVLLVDEIDRADHEFEAFLLEFLSDFQITIPERGTLAAEGRPIIVLTSNRTRELHDALRRRCIYKWIDYPDAQQETEIILRRAPGLARSTARAVATAIHGLRELPLAKPPGIAEAIEWSEAAALIRQGDDWPAALRRAVGALIKDDGDMGLVAQQMPQLLEKAFA